MEEKRITTVIMIGGGSVIILDRDGRKREEKGKVGKRGKKEVLLADFN